jgi:hypothetical protein
VTFKTVEKVFLIFLLDDGRNRIKLGKRIRQQIRNEENSCFEKLSFKRAGDFSLCLIVLEEG